MKHVYPKLYGTSSSGKVKEWEIWVEDIDGVPNIVNRHGYEDGKKQVNAKPVPVGKNIGKANETTPFQQACMDAESKWNLKKDKKYITERPTKHNQSEIILPMLAHSYEKRKHNIKFPCFVQPKMNGVRCLAFIKDGKVTYQSRRGKTWDTLEHLTPHLKHLLDMILDGEIYIHNENFQSITSLSKKIQPGIEKLEYWVYDIAIAGIPFVHRIDLINRYIKPIGGIIVPVETHICQDESKLKPFHDKFVQDGYEGLIIRNADGLYKFDHRSADLQKYKEFFDEEYLIVGGKAGTGIHDGCVVFECMTSNEKLFSCYPKGSLEYRRELFTKLPELIGKQLTIRYQEKSNDGIPIFPIGIAIRDYE